MDRASDCRMQEKSLLSNECPITVYVRLKIKQSTLSQNFFYSLHLTFLHSTRPALEIFVVMSGVGYLVSHWAAGAFQRTDLRCSDAGFFESITCVGVWDGGRAG